MFLATLSSCSPAYIPNARNTPLFTAKKQVSVVAIASLNSEGPAAELQAAYAVTDHLAIMADAQRLSMTDLDRSGKSFKRTHTFAEGGLGYFTKLERIRFETFVGYGVGNDYGPATYPFFDNNQYRVRSNYSRYFIQPSIGNADPSAFVTYSFTSRLSALRFNEFIAEGRPGPGSKYTPPQKLDFILEPSITSTFRIADNFRVFVQTGASLPLSIDRYYDFWPWYLGVGLQIHNIR